MEDEGITGQFGNQKQFVRSYTRSDGTVVPNYYREYAPSISNEARQNALRLYTKNTAAYQGENEEVNRFKAANKVKGTSATSFFPANQREFFETAQRQGGYIVNPAKATASNPGGLFAYLLDDEGNPRLYEIYREQTGVNAEGKPIFADEYSARLATSKSKVGGRSLGQYFSGSEPGIQSGYPPYAFGKAESEANIIGKNANPLRGYAQRLRTATGVNGGTTLLLTPDQFAAFTRTSRTDPLFAAKYEAYSINPGNSIVNKLIMGRQAEYEQVLGPFAQVRVIPNTTTDIYIRNPNVGPLADIPILRDILPATQRATIYDVEPVGSVIQPVKDFLNEINEGGLETPQGQSFESVLPQRAPASSQLPSELRSVYLPSAASSLLSPSNISSASPSLSANAYPSSAYSRASSSPASSTLSSVVSPSASSLTASSVPSSPRISEISSPYSASPYASQSASASPSFSQSPSVSPSISPSPSSSYSPPPTTKRTIYPPIIPSIAQAKLIQQQREIAGSQKAYGVYHPEFNILGEQGPLTAGAELGVGSRPQFVTPQDVASLNSEGIAVPIENQAQPNPAPQTVTTQTGIVVVDPSTLQELGYIRPAMAVA